MLCTPRTVVVSVVTGAVLATVAAASPGPSSITVAPETKAAARQLLGGTLLDGQAYEYERQLADMIGPRLTGSANYEQAAKWAAQEFTSIGLSKVREEEWTIPATWEPEAPAAGHIVSPVEHAFHIVSLGWSPSTPAGGVTGNVVYVKHLAAEQLDEQKAELKGAIALFDRESLGEKSNLLGILSALDHLRSLGPLAIMGTGIANGAESLTALSFKGTIAPQPQVQVGLEDSLLIKRLLERGPVSLQFSATNRIRTEAAVHNVIAELPGSDPSAGMVLIGAHLDSWQPGTGAQDNGTGVAGLLEAARAIKALNRPPRRTIRFVLFGGEEQGLLGSAAYARQHRAEMENIDVMLNTDSGSEAAKGWMLMGREDEKSALQTLKPLLSGLGADGISSDTKFVFQTDHAPFEFLGVPVLVLWTATDKYMALHHKASDTFDAVVSKDLAQGAAVLALTCYAIADSAQPFAAHLSPAEVRGMAE